MRLSKIISFLLSFLIFSSNVSAFSFWFERGAYVTYSALVDEEEYVGILHLNKTTILRCKGDAFLTFKIVEIDNKVAKINITLDISRGELITLHSSGKTERKEITNVTFSKVLFLNISNMEYFDKNGTSYGRATFFIDPRNVRKGTIIGQWGNATLFINEIESITNITFLTHFHAFKPPVLLAKTNRISYEGALGGDLFYYDLSTGILIGGFIPFAPELRALGISHGSLIDQVAQENQKKLLQGLSLEEALKLDKRWVAGIVLYDTNIEFEPKTEVKKEETPTKYLFLASLGILLMVVVLRRRLH